MKAVREFKAKPKSTTFLMFTADCFIKLNPNQVWTVTEFNLDGVISYTAKHKNITLNFKQGRFNLMFKRVKD